MAETFLALTRWQWVAVVLWTLMTVLSGGPEYSATRLFGGLFGSYVLVFLVGSVWRWLNKYRAQKAEATR